MNTTKSNTSRIAMLTLFIVGAVAFACQSESAPGLALVPGQVVIDDPCTHSAESEIRNTTMTELTEDGVSYVTIVGRVKPGAAYTMTHLVEEDLRGEQYFIDGTIYEREEAEPGVWEDWEVREISLPFGQSWPPEIDESFYEGKTFICGEEVTDNGRYMDGAVLDGIEVLHFEIARVEDDLLPGQISYVTEVWVDHSGRLHKRLIRDVSEDYTHEVITRITNHGDDIVIEPPDVSGQ